jgi:hypothetical protein
MKGLLPAFDVLILGALYAGFVFASSDTHQHTVSGVVETAGPANAAIYNSEYRYIRLQGDTSKKYICYLPQVQACIAVAEGLKVTMQIEQDDKVTSFQLKS